MPQLDRSRAEIGELIGRLFDRLDTQFGHGKYEINDAMLLVEISDLDDLMDVDGRDVPATVVLLESTSDRVTVQGGIVEFARRTLIGGGAVEDDDD